MIICQGVPIMHHFERFTVDLDEKLGDSLLECPQLYHNMGFPGDPQNGIILPLLWRFLLIFWQQKKQLHFCNCLIFSGATGTTFEERFTEHYRLTL